MIYRLRRFTTVTKSLSTLFRSREVQWSLKHNYFYRSQSTVLNLSAMVSENDDKIAFERLPLSAIPEHYVINLIPDLKNFVFEGDQTIDIQVREATKTIKINAAKLTISDVVVKFGNGSDLAASNIDLNADEETVTFTFPSPLTLGSGKLSMKFKGELNDNQQGWYRCHNPQPDDENAYSATTQFEPTDARQAFPCWDEPALKATFEVTLTVPKGKIGLSNMNATSDVPHPSIPDARLITFAKTPKVSTYLIAFVVGQYDFVEGKTTDGKVDLRVFTPVGKKEQGQLCLDVTSRILPFYTDYFNIGYPLPKLDQIALADFASAAMENWGLITYRERCILVDPQNTSASVKQMCVINISHEIAHQWFGNLVTMEWWTDLWLNEGFATWIEHLCTDHLFPDYHIWNQFVSVIVLAALRLDSLESSHPIQVVVGHPSEIDEIFDEISYDKGASIIRMLHNFIGDEAFRKGMHAYLTKFQLSNTQTSDLWASLSEASGKDVNKMMSKWTLQMGYPVIKVTAKNEGEKRVLSLSQSRFTINPAGRDDSLWMVPVSVVVGSSPKTVKTQVVLETKDTTVEIDGINNKDWIKLNSGTIGFYRVHYPAEWLEEFIPAIKNQTMPVLDRVGLLDDVCSLAESGHIPTVQALQFLLAYRDDTDYTVWHTVNGWLGVFNAIFSHDPELSEAYRRYGRHLVSVIASRLGWQAGAGDDPNQSHLNNMLRSMVLDRICLFGAEPYVDEAKRKFLAHCNGTALIPADIRKAVYRAVGSVGDDAIYNSLIKLYSESDLSEEKERIMSGLGRLPQRHHMEKLMNYASESGAVRPQDMISTMTHIAVSGGLGRDYMWQYVRENWDKLTAKYTSPFLFTRVLKHTMEYYVTEAKAAELEQWMIDHPFPGSERKVQQAAESIRNNSRWLSRDAENVRKWFKSTEFN